VADETSASSGESEVYEVEQLSEVHCAQITAVRIRSRGQNGHDLAHSQPFPPYRLANLRGDEALAIANSAERRSVTFPPKRWNAPTDQCILLNMSDVTEILTALEKGDSHAAEQLLPLVYDELRKLAAARMASERSDHTLQATALVHEAYVRLVDDRNSASWNSRGHFFGAAAEAMRRILIDAAQRKSAKKRGGGHERIELDFANLKVLPQSDDLLALNEALEQLAEQQPIAAELVKLRYFAGLTNLEAAKSLGISARKADTLWAYARVWLHQRIYGCEESASP
jgi:RNA polymerase sigma factor (TIGR02999 family)